MTVFADVNAEALVIFGDYLSAASFLGIAGLIFLYGFDGFLYSIGFLVAFLTVMFLLAERMRNAGKFTIADVLSFRLREQPARVAAATGTLAVAGFYLIAQMVGAGALTTALGFGARAFLGQEGVEAAGAGGNLAAPNLAQFLGGGEGTVGGDAFLAIIAAIAFATILAVVAGLVISASGAVAHDL